MVTHALPLSTQKSTLFPRMGCLGEPAASGYTLKSHLSGHWVLLLHLLQPGAALRVVPQFPHLWISSNNSFPVADCSRMLTESGPQGALPALSLPPHLGQILGTLNSPCSSPLSPHAA
jgi:hypothetical protein